MDGRIILLSDPVASGKSMLAGRLSDRFNMKLLRTSDKLRAMMTGSSEWYQRARIFPKQKFFYILSFAPILRGHRDLVYDFN